MDQILDTVGQTIDDIINSPVVQITGRLIFVYLVVLWIASAYWAFRDMQHRTENPILPYVAASFVIAVAGAMLATVGLEALGLGPQNELTLGMMIYWAQYSGAILRGMWWWWVPPVVALALIFVALLAASTGMDRLVNARLRVEG